VQLQVKKGFIEVFIINYPGLATAFLFSYYTRSKTIAPDILITRHPFCEWRSLRQSGVPPRYLVGNSEDRAVNWQCSSPNAFISGDFQSACWNCRYHTTVCSALFLKPVWNNTPNTLVEQFSWLETEPSPSTRSMMEVESEEHFHALPPRLEPVKGVKFVSKSSGADDVGSYAFSH